jgi:hypothetical protein
VECRLVVAGEGDQAEARVVAPQPGCRRDAVEKRHVDVEHDRIRVDVVGKLDRPEAVRGGRDDLDPVQQTDEQREALADGALRALVASPAEALGPATRDADGLRFMIG